MKAIICSQYGPPEDLHLEEVDLPDPGPGEIRIKVKSTAINDYDWSLVRGKPILYRLVYGLFKPKSSARIPGMEVSGVVDALGEDVSHFQLGDSVYGDISRYGFGSFAEYLCIDEKAVFSKPPEMSFEEAAALPHAALLAWQGFKLGQLKQDQNILINGAGGGVGTLGLQMAKLNGNHVTGVDTGEKLELMRTIGFDEVLDYKKTDFTSTGKRYDLILDTKTNRAPSAYRRALSPGGVYVTVGGKLGRILQLLGTRLLGNKNLHLLSLKPNEGLEHVDQLYCEGHLKIVIDGPYPLEKIPWAIGYFGAGRHTGKVVISLS
ncbi:MAG: NAD(P)-dependent alcohol dehydrogenase [Eudoraea sp.]|nr:NAD(P)-dependent alcohol dehydrogenase [Eudoraea sp.]